MGKYAVINPATGETVKEYPDMSDEELEAAIAAADDAHKNWGLESSVAERAALVKKVADFQTERRETLAEIIVREMGKPMEQALGEVDFCADIYGFYADRAEELLADEPIELLAGDGTALVRKSSVGPLVGIMPWNFPYYQVARFAGPNLVVGNTVLLKPAHQCPESAEAIQSMMADAGFPDGAYQTILASNDQIEKAIEDPRVRGVSLTGSERAGAAVAEIAGRNLKKVVLELGGSDPFILLGADDMDEAVEAAVAGRLDNTGQSCNAAKRFIVADETLRRLPREVQREDDRDEGRRSDLRGRRDGAALVGLGHSDPAGSARPGGRPRGRGRRRRRPGWQLLLEHCADRDHARQRRLPRGVLRAGRERVPRRLRGRRRSSSPTTPRSASAPTCSRTIPSRRSGSPTPSTPGWSTSTASASTVRSCRSAASSARASAASSAATGSRSSSTRS